MKVREEEKAAKLNGSIGGATGGGAPKNQVVSIGKDAGGGDQLRLGGKGIAHGG